jgi:hypothetical protein
MNKAWLQVALGAFFALTASCQPEPSNERNTGFANYPGLAKAIKRAEQVVLWEGLPHQAFEKQLLEEELKAKEVVWYHGFPFYVEPLPLKEEDGQELTSIVTNRDTFQPWSGAKKCGGFHPDYGIEWQVANVPYRCLVCFGCREVKIFGPGSEAYCDMTTLGTAELEKVLKAYHKHRPKTKLRDW